jgi:DNA-binding transcriptional LysR family regulator
MGTGAAEWHLFRTFLAVVREGSLSSAARVLGATQPTVGRQIASLEASLGIKLFVRSHDGLLPTEAALRLLSSVEAMAAAAEAAQRSASGDVDEERGTVRITASDVIGAEVLPDVLHSLRIRYPKISIELALSNRNEDLLHGDADIAVRMIRPTQGALVAKRLGRIDIGLYAHRRYLKARALPRSLQELRQHALIGYDRDPAVAQMVAKMGVMLSRDMFAFRSDSDLAQLGALRAGLGIGASQLGIANRDKSLVPVLHAQLVFTVEMWLAMHSDLRGNRRIQTTFDHLATHLSDYAKTSRRQ